MAHYFTADTHFGDDNIRQFFGRPFLSAADMDTAMLAGTAFIGADDDYWHLGDFAACDSDAERANAKRMFDAIPGRKHLIRGNHDSDWTADLPWASVHELFELDVGARRFVLCHYPLLSWNGARSGALHLFGHVHTRWRGAEGMVNVGVDLWQFGVVSAEAAELGALTLPPSKLRKRVEGM